MHQSMKRLKRALSLTKSSPRIEESIAEIDEHTLTKDSYLDPLHENPVNGDIKKSSCNGNNNTSSNNKCKFLNVLSNVVVWILISIYDFEFSKVMR